MTQLKNDRIQAKELTLRTSKGRIIYVTLFSTFTKNINGEFNGSLGILYDITEKKELGAIRKVRKLYAIVRKSTAGCDEHLAKPIERTRLFKTIAKYVPSKEPALLGAPDSAQS